MQYDEQSTALTEAERETRKKQKREAKALKRALRERQKLENKMRLDKRPDVRMSALLDIRKAEDGGNFTVQQVHAGGGNNGNRVLECEGKNKDERSESVGDGIHSKKMKIGEGEGHQEVISLMDRSLSKFSLSLLGQRPSLISIIELDVSHNRLSELPGLSALKNLVSLNICRNEFRSLPNELVHLPLLSRLNASRNELRPSADFLVLLTQPPLPSLGVIDLTFNKKIFTKSMSDLLTAALPTAAVYITVTSPPPKGAYEGDSPGERDPTLLRSQLEPYTTLQLRQRLVNTFGHKSHSMYGSPPEGRAEVMMSLLKKYEKLGPRKLVRSLGVAVPNPIIDIVRKELEAWSDRYDKFQERPMIKASKYMILRSPTEAEEKMIKLGSRRAHSAIRKYQQNLSLWGAAKAAMTTVDKDFAEAFTGLAVTKNFVGSPHIDTTNIGPFYGMSIGDFDDGTGGVQVELDPLTICEVNTKNRLGRIDGRFPHWVSPYSREKERYSLIFYLTEGTISPKIAAVFGDILEPGL
mmetsp:Transcript_29666/g.45364  ORF Transcript_29666/g.45364 Transcript_29666/m.45364 type:complete len:524 (-) Transcript_29666:652-2223(-)